jgi:hypothetical protein
MNIKKSILFKILNFMYIGLIKIERIKWILFIMFFFLLYYFFISRIISQR